jgi:hypothetical protein
MRNLRRRVEALEKSRRAKRHSHTRMAEEAMVCLWPDDAEQLLGAYGADRVGRPLTEPEAKARSSFAETFERECQRAGFQSMRCEHTPDVREVVIRMAVIRLVARRLSSEQFALCRESILAVEKGRAPTDAESVAMEAYRSEMERLAQLAGLGDAQELEALMWRVQMSESADRC